MYCPFTPKTNNMKLKRKKPVFESLYQHARQKQSREEDLNYFKQIECILLKGTGSTKTHEKLYQAGKQQRENLKQKKKFFELLASQETPFRPKTTSLLSIPKLELPLAGQYSDRF